MMTRNIAYKYGLANGTRGKLVGVVYPVGAPVGSFPEALIVEVPEYRGPAFYPSEPKWVPILPKVSIKEGTRQTREQFPVVAGYALTVNKAQGLTLKQGAVIKLTSGKRFRAASKHGLPFVAFTRSESFAMTAVKHLPRGTTSRKAGTRTCNACARASGKCWTASTPRPCAGTRS